MKNKVITAVLSLLLITAVGCQQNNPDQAGRQDNQSSNMQEVKQSVDEPGTNNKKTPSSKEISRNLVKVANSEPQVKGATAIVTMGYAAVGIDVANDLERTSVDNVKYAVSEALSDQRYGANAVVIADPDAVEQLKDMKSDIQDGRPVTGVMDQLADIIGRFAPQMPNDTKNQNDNKKSNKNQPQAPDNQKRGPQKIENQQDTKSGNNNQASNDDPSGQQPSKSKNS